MNVILRWIDVAPNLATRTQPSVLIKRPAPAERENPPPFAVAQPSKVGEFWVPNSDLLKLDIQWSVTVKGDHVRVYVTAYRTESMAKSSILATGMELGARAGISLARRDHRDPMEMQLVVGKQCDVAPGGQAYLCYVGIAFRME